jgi:hypothetical protein
MKSVLIFSLSAFLAACGTAPNEYIHHGGNSTQGTSVAAPSAQATTTVSGSINTPTKPSTPSTPTPSAPVATKPTPVTPKPSCGCKSEHGEGHDGGKGKRGEHNESRGGGHHGK